MRLDWFVKNGLLCELLSSEAHAVTRRDLPVVDK